jgi:hypothetical protein
MGTIPRHKDGTNKSGNSKDDFALDPNTAGKYAKSVKASLPSEVDFKVVPFEDIKAINFEQTNSSDIVGSAMKNFYRTAGADQALFSADKANASTIKAGTRIDAAFVERAYEQFSTFCTYHVNKHTKKFKFKICMEGTIFDQEDRRAAALENAQNGIITPKLASANGMSLRDMQTSINLMQMLGFPDKLKPLASSFNTSQKDAKAGRPESKNGTEDKDNAIDTGKNENKKIVNES